MRLKWLWLIAPCAVPVAIACVGDDPSTTAPDTADSSSDAFVAQDSAPPADAGVDTGIVNVETTFGEQTGSAHTGVTSDTDIQWSNPTLNFGSSADIIVHGSLDAGSSLIIGLLHFDLSTLPTNSNVVAASLVLATSTGSGCALNAGHKIGVYQMQQAWVAGTMDGDAGVANYTNAQASTAWLGLGVTPPSVADASTVEFEPADTGTQYEIPITALVKNWVASPSANFGVALEVEEAIVDGACFVSSDSPAKPELRPLLKITLGVAK